MHPTKVSLISLIDTGRESNIVLTHFEGFFIWNRQSIEELLVGVINDCFVGSIWAGRSTELRARNKHHRATQCP